MRRTLNVTPSTMQYYENSSCSFSDSIPITLHNSLITSSTTVVDLVLITLSVPPGNLNKCEYWSQVKILLNDRNNIQNITVL